MARRDAIDGLVDLDPVSDHCRDKFARQIRGDRIAFGLGQMTLKDGLGRTLAEVGLEDRSERETAPGAGAPLPVSLRRHRR